MNLTVGTLTDSKEEATELAKEAGSHVLREVTHKIWEYFTSGEFMDDVGDVLDSAAGLLV